jgi:hypothetical protein
MREVVISLVGGVMPQVANLYDSGLIYFPGSGEWSHIARELQFQRIVKDLVVKPEEQSLAEKRKPGRPKK